MKRCRAKKKSQKEKKADVELEVLDGEMWKEFPQDLLEVVIARLPIATFIRFRLVCQKWNSLPKSPSFQQLWANFAPQKQPLFSAVVRVGDGDVEIGVLYDPSKKEWRRTNHTPPSSYMGLFIPASSGGLVCYTDRIHSSSFWVGNFLTQTWKEFPWPSWTECNPQHMATVVGMVTLNQDYSQLSSRAVGYKLAWANPGGTYRVYDSLKEDITSGRVPANIMLPWIFELRTVSIDTVVYFRTCKPDGIIAYDTVSGAWEQLLIPNPPDSSMTSLAECGGRILLVGMVFNSADYVCVWELETAMLQWTEVDRMPSSWCSKFSPRDPMPNFACLGNTRVLVMSLSTNRIRWILTYDVVSREWSKAPRLSILGRYPKIINGVNFVPCLSASP